MKKFILEQSNEFFTSLTGLAAVGALISRTKLKERLNKVKMLGAAKPKISNGDLAVAYLGLLCQGKSDFDQIEPYRKDDFFSISLSLAEVPAAPTLRQRFELGAKSPLWKRIVKEENIRLLNKAAVTLTPIPLDSQRLVIPLDIDVSPFDNSGTKKQGVSRTYKGVDGYAPIFAYAGREGFLANLELREGKTHSQKGMTEFLEETLSLVQPLVSHPLLLRVDGAHDSVDNIQVCRKKGAEFIIKRNLRQESHLQWLLEAREHASVVLEPREGKKVYLGEKRVVKEELEQPVRMVYQVIERTMEANGQLLLAPDVEIACFWTSLPDSPSTIVRLYQDHGTSEQFHSEIKSDLDLERLPSGKFETNNWVLHLGMLAYNILRIMGQESLKKEDAPIPNTVKRRRIRTVIQNLITIASQLVFHARRYRLKFGRKSPWFENFKRVYEAFA